MPHQPGYVAYRSGLSPIIDLLAKLANLELKLTDKYLEEMKKTEFWNIIKPIKEQKFRKGDCIKSTEAQKYIIQHYKPGEIIDGTHIFYIGGKQLESHPKYVAQTFGMKRIKMTNEEKRNRYDRIMDKKKLKESDLYCYIKHIVPEKIRTRNNTQGLKEKSKGEKNVGAQEQGVKSSSERLLKREIFDAIKEVVIEENREEDFVRLLVLYICCTTFFPVESGSYINYKFLQCVESIEVINKMSWPDLIHENLMDEIARKYDNYPLTVMGCTVYLLYWAFHFTGIPKTVLESYEEEEQSNFPWVLMWNLTEASCALEAKLLSFPKDEVIEIEDSPVPPTPPSSPISIDSSTPVLVPSPKVNMTGKRNQENDALTEVSGKDKGEVALCSSSCISKKRVKQEGLATSVAENVEASHGNSEPNLASVHNLTTREQNLAKVMLNNKGSQLSTQAPSSSNVFNSINDLSSNDGLNSSNSGDESMYSKECVNLLDRERNIVATGYMANGKESEVCHGRKVYPGEKKVFIQVVKDPTAPVPDPPQGGGHFTLAGYVEGGWIIWSESRLSKRKLNLLDREKNIVATGYIVNGKESEVCHGRTVYPGEKKVRIEVVIDPTAAVPDPPQGDGHYTLAGYVEGESIIWAESRLSYEG